MGDDDMFWVFGYGSLMWRPGFDARESHQALLAGYHRDLCVKSVVHRGTAENPGLVMGLRNGGSCRGIAFGIDEGMKDEVVSYLHARELINNVYAPRWMKVRLGDGRTKQAYTFMPVRNHLQWAGDLDLAERVKLIREGKGEGGRCLDYLRNTIAHLDAFDIFDARLHQLLSLAENENAASN